MSEIFKQVAKGVLGFGIVGGGVVTAVAGVGIVSEASGALTEAISELFSIAGEAIKEAA